MTQPLRVATLNGGYTTPSKTGAIIELVLEELATSYQLEVTRVNISELGPGFTGALTPDELADDIRATMQSIADADLLIAGTAVYRGAYTGLFKHYIDLMDQYALAGKPVLLVATGGSERHTLVIDQVLRPLFGFMQAAVAPSGIYASSGDFSGTILLNPDIYGRIEVAVEDLRPTLDRLVEKPAR